MNAVSEPRARPHLLLPLRNRAQFLEQYIQKNEEGGLFVPGELDVALGETVDLELAFAEEHVRFHIRAQIKWKRQGPDRRALPPGVGIGFQASEARTQARLLAFAEGRESITHVDRDRRYPLRLEVVVTTAAERFTALTDDLSESGCFLLTSRPLPVGETVDLALPARVDGLRPPAWLPRRLAQLLPGSPLHLRGAVAWRRTDEKADTSGIGVELAFRSLREQERARRVVLRLKERLVREVRVTTPRHLRASGTFE